MLSLSTYYQVIFHVILTRKGRIWNVTSVEGTPMNPNNPIDAATETNTRITPNMLSENFFSAKNCLMLHVYHFAEVDDTFPNMNII